MIDKKDKKKIIYVEPNIYNLLYWYLSLSKDKEVSHDMQNMQRKN